MNSGLISRQGGWLREGKSHDGNESIAHLFQFEGGHLQRMAPVALGKNIVTAFHDQLDELIELVLRNSGGVLDVVANHGRLTRSHWHRFLECEANFHQIQLMGEDQFLQLTMSMHQRGAAGLSVIVVKPEHLILEIVRHERKGGTKDDFHLEYFDEIRRDKVKTEDLKPERIYQGAPASSTGATTAHAEITVGMVSRLNMRLCFYRGLGWVMGRKILGWLTPSRPYTPSHRS